MSRSKARSHGSSTFAACDVTRLQTRPLAIGPRPAPEYLTDRVEFQDAWGDWHLLAKWGETNEFWLFFWNPNYDCWTSLRKPSDRDLDYIEKCDRDGVAFLK